MLKLNHPPKPQNKNITHMPASEKTNVRQPKNSSAASTLFPLVTWGYVRRVCTQSDFQLLCNEKVGYPPRLCATQIATNGQAAAVVTKHQNIFGMDLKL